LLDYSKHLPINDIPGISALTLDGKLIAISDTFAHLIGFNKAEQAFEVGYHEQPCKASENADAFVEQDRLAVQQDINILAYHKYTEWTLLLGQKKAVKSAGQIIGIFHHYMDVTNNCVVDIARFLFDENRKINRQQFAYVVADFNNQIKLTKKEQECLFYYVRGFTYKEIAAVLYNSDRTIECHLENIKAKLDCSNRAQIVEKASHLGFMNYIPKSLLHTR